MKILFTTSAVLILFSTMLFAQSQGDRPRGNWTEWHVVYSEQPNLKVEICFNTSTCKNGTLVGYSYYRIRSNFDRPNAWVKFGFEAIGCDGITHTTPINYKLDKPGITDNLGDWFTGYEVRRINGASYADYTPKTTVPAAQKPAGVAIIPTNPTSNLTTNNNATRSTNSNAAVYNNLNRQLQTNQQNTQLITSGLQQLETILQQNTERKQAERADAASRQRDEEEKRQADEKRKEEEQETIRADEKASEDRIAELNKIIEKATREEVNRQWKIDMLILKELFITVDNPDKTHTMTPKRVDLSATILQTVYYLAYNRSYKDNMVRLKTYALNRNSDGTWMPYQDLYQKIDFKSYVNSDGISNIFSFTTKAEALNAITIIKSRSNMASANETFINVNSKARVGSETNFRINK